MEITMIIPKYLRLKLGQCFTFVVFVMAVHVIFSMVWIDKLGKTTGSTGYWMALHFSDQGTGSYINLMSMLCLSTVVGGVRVVEPFMVDSTLGYNVSKRWSEQIPFRDIFDITGFSSFAYYTNFDQLVPYNQFQRNLPRNFIMVQYKCEGLSICHECGAKQIREQGNTFLRTNGYNHASIDYVCIQYGENNTISLQEFENQIYSKYQKSQTVVIFPIFGGVVQNKQGYRLNINHTSCNRSNVWNSTKYMNPSTQVTESANNYKNMYLGDKKYISVMLRLEMFFDKENLKKTIKCLNKFQKVVNDKKIKFGIETVVLSLDVSRYGSVYFETNKHYLLLILPYLNRFISHVVAKGMNLTALDDRLKSSSLRDNPGFVASMQKIIAARGDVLILFPGYKSSYQKSTGSIYNFLHRENQRHVIRVSTC